MTEEKANLIIMGQEYDEYDRQRHWVMDFACGPTTLDMLDEIFQDLDDDGRVTNEVEEALGYLIHLYEGKELSDG